MKTTLTFLFSAIFIIAGFSFAINNNNPDSDYNLSKREILIRKVGHEILLLAGDSTSRVLPVKKLADQQYQLLFEREFAFEPDSLVAVIRKSLASNNETDYIVNVLNCAGNEVVYGYTVSNQKKNEVIPCQGRKQPSGCYVINIKFDSNESKTKNYALAVSFFGIVLLLSYTAFRNKKKKLPVQTSNLLAIGTILFDLQKKQLIISEETINLTTKECKLLAIFAKNPNETIDRSRLQKEIWEDDGIIVGRSLDVFISKLRKKLESDVHVQLMNVHGKGYKLQIDTPKI